MAEPVFAPDLETLRGLAHRGGDRNWIRAGSLLAVGALCLSVYKGNWKFARVAALVAGAFLAKWADVRLEVKVTGLLGKARADAPADGVQDDAPAADGNGSWKAA